jgi:signal transduction histidine kinase/DNA-binding response OmpR family regulator
VGDFLVGGGELGALMREHDWARTPLGPPGQWPQSLRMAVRIMLTSRQPIWIGWGKDLTYLYNDPYKSIIGGKHPWALGRPTREVWHEIWSDIEPLLATATGGDRGTFVESQLLIMERNGYPEETYYTFSYSPIPDDDGRVGGIICANSDDTLKVIGERQLGLLRELASSTANIRSREDACAHSARALATNPHDLPFAMLYLGEPGNGAMSLAGSSGFSQDQEFAPLTIGSTASRWPIAEVLATHEIKIVDLSGDLFGIAPPSGAWDRPPKQAAVLPIASAGVLIVGLNRFRLFDENYRGFLGLAAGQIAAALANAQAYEEERKRAEALAELDRAKTTFFSNVSHEFRTPLTLMLGPIEELIATGELEPESRSQLELVHRNGMRLLRLVNSLLDFSRIEAGRMRANFEPTDLAGYSAEVAAIFRSVVEKSGLRLTVDCKELAQPVYVDREMWEKVLLNLLSNAFKFTFNGEIKVSVDQDADANVARVRVADTGIGISAEQLPRLFERFHRVEGAQGRSFEGTGIGLALVQELIKLHGGSIAAQSEPGRGTVFTIMLPFGAAHLPPDQVRQPADSPPMFSGHAFAAEALRLLPTAGETVEISAIAEASAATKGLPREQLAGFGKRILLADDNADMRDYVRRLLITQGYEVEAVEDGERALASAQNAPPDLVLTDVMMPKLDGFGVLRGIRSDPVLAGTPVLMLSARAGEEAKVEALDAAADDYLAKPFAARELLARVNSNIQMAALRRDAARAVMQSEQRFMMTQERLSLALSTGRVAVYDWDVDTDRLTIQGPLSRFFGVSPDDLSTGVPLQHVVDGIHPDDRERTMARIFETVETGAPFESEYRMHGAGEGRTVISRGHIEQRPSGQRFFSGVLIDVTEEKAAEERLREQARKLELLNSTLERRVEEEVAERIKAEEALRQAQKMEAIGQLTGGVAHDFNNLLTVIMGGLDTIRRSRPEDTARIRRATEMALVGTQRAASLTSRLLAFSRRQPLAPKPLELNNLVRDMTELLHRTLGETVELEAVLASRLWAVEVDQNQLEAAILNLAVNARDAMPEGGKLTIETANTALDGSYSEKDVEVIPGQYVMVSISDNGHGMSKESLTRAFEPFYTTKEVGRGTGLGLSMVYGFVKQSGGHVTLYSEQGQGTTVKLYFPRYMGQLTVTPDAVAGPIPLASDGEVVLVVEDSEEVRLYSMSILRELGYQVLEAATADAALDIIRRPGRIDLLFTDVVLPGRNGRALVDQAKLIRKNLAVLYTTGYSRNAIVHHGRLDPNTDLISKPFTFDELAVRVRDVIDRTLPASDSTVS